MNFNKLIYKKLAPFIGKLFDKLFFTDFGKRASNYYHLYDQNDYKFEKDEYCFIHVPRTGVGHSGTILKILIFLSRPINKMATIIQFLFYVPQVITNMLL